jgi:hypothetical protein
VEKQFVELALEQWFKEAKRAPSAREQQRFQLRSRRALRCTVLRTLLQEDFRGFSCQLAGNPLYQWFCLVDAIDQIRVPTKSELQRFATWLPADTMRQLINTVLGSGLNKPRKLELKEPINLEEYFLDTTCLKANIHYPVDWVLLRDAVRTLMKATRLIRQQGLRGRMEAPEIFLRRINRLCIEMTHQGRGEQSQKGRKRVLRRMKKVLKIVEAHARRHRQLLDQGWEKTDWTRAQAELVLRRIDGVLELLPRARKQAHDRIIGERTIQNQEKVLSLYESEVHVLVRGKAGAPVEFGNTLLLGENRQGIILDFKLYREQIRSDGHLLGESLERVSMGLGKSVEAVGADRGFSNAMNSQRLKEAGIFNGLCPRQPRELRKRMRQGRFARLQRRRAQTEGRIGILKQNFFGQPMRAKGFANRELAVAWAVLTHNLWMLAKLRRVKKAKPRKRLLLAA